MKKTVCINEIGPRDGFQNVEEFIPTSVKIAIIDGAIASGIKRVQLTSFVSPKAIPQMRDAAEVAQACLDRYPDVSFYALVPNLKGAENAAKCGLKEISAVISVSESHNLANVRKTLDESFAQLGEMVSAFPDVHIILDAATAFGCPDEGITSYGRLKAYMERARDLGINASTVCDSIGVAHPNQVREYFTRLREDFPEMTFRAHIHDTRNMGMINTLTAVECGVTDVEVAVGGLGGCPFAAGATGNTSTEDFVYMLHELGYETGICFDRLLETAKYAKEHVRGNFSGHQINITRSCRVQ